MIKTVAQLLNTFFSSVFTKENVTQSQIPEVKNRDETEGEDEKLKTLKLTVSWCSTNWLNKRKESTM